MSKKLLVFVLPPGCRRKGPHISRGKLSGPGMLDVYIILFSKCQENGYIQFSGMKQNFRKITEGRKAGGDTPAISLTQLLMAIVLPFCVFQTISLRSVMLMLIDLFIHLSIHPTIYASICMKSQLQHGGSQIFVVPWRISSDMQSLIGCSMWDLVP